MAVVYHTRRRFEKLSVFRLLIAANIGFAVGVLVAWQGTIETILALIGWLAGAQVPASTDWMAVVSYPLALFWLAPLLATFGAYFELKAARDRAALGLLLLPLLVSIISFTMHELTPAMQSF